MMVDKYDTNESNNYSNDDDDDDNFYVCVCVCLDSIVYICTHYDGCSMLKAMNMRILHTRTGVIFPNPLMRTTWVWNLQ